MSFFPCQCTGAGIACWLERRSRDRKVASSNPGRNGGRMFSSRVNFFVPTLYSVSVPPPCYRSGTYKTQSSCQKYRWQVTPKHAYILDPTKWEWVDYAAIQAWCGNLSGNELTRNSSGNTRSQSSQLVEPLWTDPGQRVELVCASLSLR